MASLDDADPPGAVAYPLLAIIEKRLADLTSRPGDATRHLTACTMARALDLLRTMDLLQRTGVAGGMHILSRSVFEMVIVGQYIALGGPEALDVVLGDHARSLNAMARTLKSKEFSQAVVEGWEDIDPRRLNLETVCRLLGRLLAEAGYQDADASGLYDTVYRGDSTYGVHGVGAAFQYMTDRGGAWGIRLEPTFEREKPWVRFLLGTVWVGHSAVVVSERWGYSKAQLEEGVADVVRFLELHAPSQ